MPSFLTQRDDVGSLRHRLTVQAVTATAQRPSAAGVPPQTAAETWTSVGTYWGRVEPQQVRRTVGVDAPKGSLWHKVVMRHPGFRLTTKHRLIFQARVLVIDSVSRRDERSEFLDLTCTENDT